MKGNTQPVSIHIPDVGWVSVIGACTEDKYLRLICLTQEKQEILLNLDTVQTWFNRSSSVPF
jgi:hypothetical protein